MHACFIPKLHCLLPIGYFITAPMGLLFLHVIQDKENQKSSEIHSYELILLILSQGLGFCRSSEYFCSSNCTPMNQWS